MPHCECVARDEWFSNLCSFPMATHLILLTILLAMVMYMAIASANAKKKATGTAAQKAQLDKDLRGVETVGLVTALLGLLLMGVMLSFERQKASLGKLMTLLVIVVIAASVAGAYGAETVRTYMRFGRSEEARNTLDRLTWGSSVAAGVIGLVWLYSLWRMYQSRRRGRPLPHVFVSGDPRSPPAVGPRRRYQPFM